MKITDLSILCKWENLKNRQCIKYLFAPLYIFNQIQIQSITWICDPGPKTSHKGQIFRN